MTLFLSGFLLSLSLCLDLGMVNVALLRAGVHRGAIPAFMMGVGSSFGDLLYAVLSMIGISFLLENLIFRWGLWIGGTIILLYMTWSMARELFRPKKIELGSGEESKSSKSLVKDFVSGLGLALASPSAILWFATIGGSVIASSSGASEASLVQFFGGFFSASIVWSIFMAYLASQGGKLMGPKLIRGFSFLSALLFLYFAGKVFLNGYQTLL